MIKGIVAASRSVFFTLCLLGIVLYVFGILFRQVTDGSNVGRELFGSIGQAMYTLLLHGALLDSAGMVLARLDAEQPSLSVLFLFFILIASLTLLNMLIGVLCEVVSSVADAEQEEMALSFVKSRIFSVVDSDCNHKISKDEFLGILENREAALSLQHVGVDAVELVDYADFIFAGGLSRDDSGLHSVYEVDQSEDRELSFEELMDLILQFRGSQAATVKDIVDLRKYFRVEMLQKHTQMEEMFESIKATRNRLETVVRETRFDRDVRLGTSVRDETATRFGSCVHDGRDTRLSSPG
eukprot:gnl/TRDRNA2_/TRDRNA2_202692_c0_seq1.p1 gnl/TRDRNA2_/TRDRNA2_202692_c0~~gnl/TRDRNA2_/TRDRNA2_202692_c0_seq1.p1  ORF type:complete len:297 (+),score=45.51 gnl/TRDRNA2_/TRDRNA2_202692_c0_seq1:44-934(+)